MLGTWRCGEAAASAMRRLTSDKCVSCERRGIDKYERVLAVCFADGADINAEMVREGLAWAFVKYSQSYVREEARAHADRVGIWQGDAQPPWEFRAHRWAGVEEAAPRGCAIKGNVIAQRAHLSHAVEPLVREGQDRGQQGQALVLLRSRGAGGRLAASGRTLSSMPAKPLQLNAS